MSSTKRADGRNGTAQFTFLLKPAAFAVAAALGLGFGSGAALANPTGPAVVNGQVTINQAGNLLSVTNSPNAIINWQSFSIGANEITRFMQQSASSAVLNRVMGAGGVIDPSVILGALQSNGRVFLINPSGIVFGAGSQVDVAGLVASSLNLSNADFLGGRLRFSEVPGAGAVVNQGAINAGPGGQVYLVGPSVTNSGIITSPKGEVILAAGNSVELVDPGTPNLRVEITASSNEAKNLGSIVADAGRVGIYAGLITHSGTIRADSAVATEDGRIVLKATRDINLEAGSVTTANGPAGGRIEVNAGDTALVAGTVEAKGSSGRGGVVHVLGDKVGIYGNARVDVSGEAGGGTVLAGGEFQGQPGVTAVEGTAIRNATATFLGADASIAADAIASGDGGKVVVWSDNTTRSYGAISARGGAASGNGGLVETSGKIVLDVTRGPDLRAPNGLGGTWLLDPNDLVVDFGSNIVNNTAQPMFSTLGDSSFVGVDLINLQLDAGSSVLLTTASQGPANGAQLGNITIKAPILKSTSTTPARFIGTTDLEIRAHNNIIIEATGGIAATENVGPLGTMVQADRLNVTLTADIDATGGGGVTLGGGIATKGGFVSISGRDLIAINAPINTTRTGATAGSVTLSSSNNGVSVAAPVNGASFSATASGTGASLDIVAPVNATSATLVADAMTIQAPVTTTGGITVRQNAAARPMNLGTKVAGALSLTQAELSNLVNAGVSTFGNSQTGAFTVSAPVTAGSSSVAINSQASFIVSPGASLTAGAASRVPLTVNAPAATIDGPIDAQNVTFSNIGTMAVNAPVTAGNIVISAPGAVSLGGAGGGLQLDAAELGMLVTGSTNVLRISGGATTVQGPITRTGRGALSLSGSTLTQATGATIGADSLYLNFSSVNLPEANTVGTLGGSVSNLTLSNASLLTIGSVDGTNGMFTNNATISADDLNVTSQLTGSTVTIMPLTAGVRLNLGGADVPGRLNISAADLANIRGTTTTLKADDADIGGAVSASTSTAVLAIAPKTAATRALNIVGVGTKTGTALEFTPDEVNSVTANSFTLGDPTTGPVNVNAALDGATAVTHTNVFTLRSGDRATGITVSQPVTVSSGSLVLTADAMNLNQTVKSTNNDLIIVPNVAGTWDIDLGSKPVGAGLATALGLLASDVSKLSAPLGSLRIGDGIARHVTVSAPVAFSNIGTLSIKNAGILSVGPGPGGPMVTSPTSIFLTSNDIDVAAPVTTTAGDINVAPLTARNIALGSDDTGSALGLTATDFGNLRPAGVLRIGDASAITRDIDVTGNIATGPGVNTLSLVTTGSVFSGFGDITQTGGSITAPSLAARASGDITLTQNNAVDTVALRSTSRSVSITHTGANPLAIGTVDGLSGVQTLSSSQPIFIKSDELSINALVSAASGAANVFINPLTSGRPVDVGTKQPGSALGLLQTELQQIRANALTIGSSTTGNITVSASIDLESPVHIANDLVLVTDPTPTGGRSIAVNATLNVPGNINFGTQAFSNTGIVTSNSGSIAVIANSLSVGANLNAAGNIVLQPQTSTAVVVGGSPGGGFVLDDTELGRLIRGGSLFIGSSAASSLTVNYGGPALLHDVTLITAGAATFNSDFSVAGNLGIQANTMTINSMPAASITAGGTVNIQPNTGGRPVRLGTAGTGAELALTDTELMKISADTLSFDTAGTLTTTAGLDFLQGGMPKIQNLVLAGDTLAITGGPLTVPADITLRSEHFNFGSTVTSNSGGRITVANRNMGGNMDVGASLQSGLANLVTPMGVVQLGDGNTSSINISAAIAQPAGTSALAIIANGDLAQNPGATITASQLRLEAGGTIDLPHDNLVTTLAGTSGSDFIFTNAQPLTIGNVDGASGLGGGNLILKADALAIASLINNYQAVLAPRNANATMSLGINPGPGQFGIDGETELPLINSSYLTFGDTTTGNATVNAAMERSFGTLDIITGSTNAINVNTAVSGPYGVTLDSGTINISAPVTATSGSVLATARAATPLNINAPVAAGYYVSFDSAGPANINGQVTAGYGVFINAATTTTINAPVSASFGDIAIDASAATVNAALSAAYQVFIDSPITNINAPLTSQFSNVSIFAGGSGGTVNVMGPISALSSVNITADTLNIGAAINATGSSVSLQPATSLRPINIGTKTAGAFSLTAAELAFIGPDVDFLTLGASNAGPMTISDTIGSATLSKLTLLSGASIIQGAGAPVLLTKTVPGTGGASVRVGDLTVQSGNGKVDMRAANEVPGTLSIDTGGTGNDLDFNNVLPMKFQSIDPQSQRFNNFGVSGKVRITSGLFGPLPPDEVAAQAASPLLNVNFDAQLLSAIDKIADINDVLDDTDAEGKKKAEDEKKKQQECK